MKIGIHVSFLFKSERSNNPNPEAILEIIITTKTVPQIKSPPIVGVPDFFACSALNSSAFSPEMAFSLICLPILNFIKSFVNHGASMNAIKNPVILEPSINESLSKF